jgi:trans-aconitate methyltransferase
VGGITDRPVEPEARTAHWESVYGRNPVEGVSWFQPEAVVSLELIDVLGIGVDDAVIDVGGGASVLVDALLRRGCTDLTVLDIADAALRTSRDRVGADAPVRWLVHDLLTWEPERRYDLWHDRAVLHFLSGAEVDIYRDRLHRSIAPGGSVIVATFAPDGPEQCSGLPVTRYSADDLFATLGSGFSLVDTRREVHTTPGGVEQPFTWVAARRSLRPV